MTFWANKRVVVTGGAGFLGAFVVGALHRLGATVRLQLDFSAAGKPVRSLRQLRSGNFARHPGPHS